MGARAGAGINSLKTDPRSWKPGLFLEGAGAGEKKSAFQHW